MLTDEIKPGPYHEKYREFWQNNLQTIEEISSSIESSLARLEKRYSDFDTIYNEIIEQIDALSSIYSSYTTFSGKEYLLKLKALLYEYRKRYSIEGMDFSIIYFLSSRVRELRNKSFEEYPRLKHTPAALTVEKRRARIPERIEPSYQWITFGRNGSHFILPCTHLTVLEFRHAELVPGGNDSGMAIKWNDEELPVIDLFSRIQGGSAKKPFCFIVAGYKGATQCFAADSPGNRIRSGTDIITPKLRGLPHPAFASGTLRLFGKNHLYIRPEPPHIGR